jgi:hypothetical protein
MLDDAEDFGRALVTPRRLDAWLGLSPREGKAAPSRTIETAPRPKVETPLLPKGLMRNNRFSRCRALARTGMAWGCGREPAPGLERVSIRGPSVA